MVTPFITNSTGDHPTEQLAFKGGWIYWSQGSTTNSGVVGRDNGGGANQPDIPCQQITLSNNLFDSGGGKMTSGYSPFNTDNRGKTLPAFTNGRPGVCDGAILRAPLNNPSAIEPFSWGYRNGYAIRFAPNNHALKGGLLVGEDGADERGARPSNNAPDSLQLAQQNADGSRTITDGRTALASCRQARRCSIRSAGPVTISASRTPQIYPACARRRALR